MIKHLDRIYKMGFIVTLDWNMCFTITLPHYHSPNFGHECNVLVCQFDDTITNIKFSEVVECCCDIFYGWFNEHGSIIDDTTPEEFSKLTLGNITTRVKRELKLDKLL